MEVYKITKNVDIDIGGVKTYLPIIINNQDGKIKKLSLIGHLFFAIKAEVSSKIVQLPYLIIWLETKNDNEWIVDKQSIQVCDLNMNQIQKVTYFALTNTTKEIRIGVRSVNYRYAFIITFKTINSAFVDGHELLPSIKIYLENTSVITNNDDNITENRGDITEREHSHL